MNEKKYIPTKGINVPGIVASQLSHPPLTSAHLKELTDNSTPKLSPPPDCSIISIPSDEGEDLSEDEPASCADAIAFASSLINADDNEWLCYSSGSDSSDDNMDDDMIQGFACQRLACVNNLRSMILSNVIYSTSPPHVLKL